MFRSAADSNSIGAGLGRSYGCPHIGHVLGRVPWYCTGHWQLSQRTLIISFALFETYAFQADSTAAQNLQMLCVDV